LKQAEVELERLKEFHASIVQNVAEGIVVEDAAGCFTFVNPAAASLLGYAPGELEGQHWTAIIPPDQYALVQAANERRAHGQTDRYQLQLMRKDGARLPALVSGSPRYQDGRVAGSLAVFTDISDRVQAEQALQDSEERFKAISASAQDAIVMTDSEGLVTFWNAAAERIFGYASQDALGQAVHRLIIPQRFHEDCRGAMDSFKTLAIELGNTVGTTVEFHAVKKDGTEFLVELSLSAVKLKDGWNSIAIVRDITERKQAEKALARERNLLRTLIDNMPDFIFVKDTQSRFVVNNRAHLHALRAASQEEVLGKTDIDIFPQELAAQYYADEQALVQSGQPLVSREEPYRDQAGEERWLSTTKVPLRDSQGRVEGLVGISRDITHRKQAEQALRESEERYQRLFNSMTEGFAVHEIICDAEGKPCDYRFLEVNPAFETLTGLKKEDVLGKTVLEILPGTEPFWIETYGRVALSGEPAHFEQYSGALSRHYQVSAYRPAERRFACVFIDITERKQAEEALRASEERFALAVRGSNDGLWDWDIQNKSLYWSPRLKELLGYADDELEIDFETFASLLHPDDSQYVGAAIEAHLKQGVVYDVEERLRTKSGEYRWFRARGQAIWDEAGQPVRMVGSTTDITERKLAEAERKQAQEALIQAKEAAEAAARAKSEFLATMSHEIRTPMNAVIGMTGLLLDTALTSEQRDYVETIRSSGDGLLTIINDILDFSKIESGRLQLEEQRFNLRDCLEEALDLLAPKAAEKGLEMAYIVDDQTPEALVGDVARLRQVLVNLLGNAVKFTERGEVVVSVTCRRLTGKQCEVHFAVQDTGLGIPPERMDRLFQSFSQLDASTTRRYGGTGLGLAISRRLCELMGGRMWVESLGIPGQGSIFHFTIHAEATSNRKHVYLHRSQPRVAGKRVLIVDDNATNRRILTQQSRAWGMLPRDAASGAEALEWIRGGEPFDVAILDMQMPGMDGLTLAAEICTYRDSGSLPLVLLTSLGHPREVSQNGKGAFAAVLTKPIKPHQLYEALAGIFAGQPTPDREPAPRPYLTPQVGADHPLRILLAEDNAVNQKVARHMLEKMGYRADVAANGVEVLEALEQRPYDLVLMDVRMPEMDGLEATRRVRASWPAERQPRIFAMTAGAMPGDREECLEAGMDGYISKPVRKEELASVLSQCQRSSRSVSGEAQPAPVPNPENAPAIDLAVLNYLRGTMGEATADLLDLYLSNASGLVADMRRAAAQGDSKLLFQAAHTLKPGSATLGAMPLAALCAEVESIGRAGALAGALEKVAKVEAEYQRVKAVLGATH
jgi:PAS domain S-box-containing protein